MHNRYSNSTDSLRFSDAKAIVLRMQKEWTGKGARIIRVLPNSISLSELVAQLSDTPQEGLLPIPVGLSFETQELVAPNLLRFRAGWWWAPHAAGKSNYLASIAKSVLAQDSLGWKIYYFSFRRSSTDWIKADPIHVINRTEQGIQTLNEISEPQKHELVFQQRGIC